MSRTRHSEDGPPCKHMEALLNQAADGSSRGLKLWYATAHAARCSRCGRFLARLRETIGKLRSAKADEVPAAVLERLKNGPWRNSESEEPP